MQWHACGTILQRQSYQNTQNITPKGHHTHLCFKFTKLKMICNSSNQHAIEIDNYQQSRQL